jgi:RNA polymerase sigma factor (sigma-70 family)
VAGAEPADPGAGPGEKGEAPVGAREGLPNRGRGFACFGPALSKQGRLSPGHDLAGADLSRPAKHHPDPQRDSGWFRSHSRRGTIAALNRRPQRAAPMNAPLSSLHTTQMASLVERWQQGDRSAADELLRRVRERLEQLAHRMLRRYPVVHAQVQTADVMQAACLRLLRALGQRTPESMAHFNALAGMQIRRELLTLAHQFHRGAHQSLSEGVDLVAPETGKDEVADLEKWAAFHEAVERLPDEQRRVFDLHYYRGLTWPEIALLLQVHERTPRRHWGRALIALREALGGWAPPEEDGPEERDR